MLIVDRKQTVLLRSRCRRSMPQEVSHQRKRCRCLDSTEHFCIYMSTGSHTQACQVRLGCSVTRVPYFCPALNKRINHSTTLYQKGHQSRRLHRTTSGNLGKSLSCTYIRMHAYWMPRDSPCVHVRGIVGRQAMCLMLGLTLDRYSCKSKFQMEPT